MTSWTGKFGSMRAMVMVTLVTTIVLSLLIGDVEAHGYISAPASRSYMCKLGKATDCGGIQYEPQSVEAPKGLPFSRTADGHLCSAGLSPFYPLDRGLDSYPSTAASQINSFQWSFTAMHATTDFKYYITKQGWDSSSPLTKDDLESSPFLTVPMNGQAPPQTMSHDLSSLPSRSGRHMIYAVWTVSNTVNAFYQCVDVDFGGSSSSSGSGSVASSSNSNSDSGSNVTSNNSNSAADTDSSSSSPSSSSSGTSTDSASNNTTDGTASNAGSGKKHQAKKSCKVVRRNAASSQPQRHHELRQRRRPATGSLGAKSYRFQKRRVSEQ